MELEDLQRLKDAYEAARAQQPVDGAISEYVSALEQELWEFLNDRSLSDYLLPRLSGTWQDASDDEET